MKSSRGFILLAVATALTVLALLMYSLTKSSGLAARTGARAVDLERARLLAEAGLAHALRNMQMPDTTVCQTNQTFILGVSVSSTVYLSGSLEGIGQYTVSFVRQSNDTHNEPRPILLRAQSMLENSTTHTFDLPLPTMTFSLPGWRAGVDGRAIAGTDTPSLDTFIVQAQSNASYGAQTVLKIDGDYADEYQTLLRFDLTNFPSLAANSRILTTRLGLYVGDDGNANGTIGIHKSTGAWGNDIRWMDSTLTTYDATALSSMPHRSGKGMRWVELPTTIVTEWLTGNNYGLLLKSASRVRNLELRSNDHSPDKMFAPRLEIVYIKGCPSP